MEQKPSPVLYEQSKKIMLKNFLKDNFQAYSVRIKCSKKPLSFTTYNVKKIVHINGEREEKTFPIKQHQIDCN